MSKLSRLTISFLLLFIVAGCTSKELYQTGQEYQREQCMQKESASNYDQCMEQLGGNYEDYRNDQDDIAERD